MSQPPTPPPGGAEPTGEGAPRSAQGTGRQETAPFGPPLPGADPGAGTTRQVQLPKPPPQLRKPPLPPVPPAGYEPGRTDPIPQPPFGPPPSGQQWGPPVSGQPPYGPPPYQQPYGQPPYGPGYQPPYGQQPWGPPGMPPPPRKSNQGRIIALVIVGVVVLAGIGIGLWFAFGRGVGTVAAGSVLPTPTSAASGPPSSSAAGPTDSGTAGSTGSGGGQGIPPATRPPTGLGDNEALNVFAQQCYQGSMPSCDLLYFATVRNDSVKAYNAYGQTCAGRQPASSSRLCSEAFPA